MPDTPDSRPDHSTAEVLESGGGGRFVREPRERRPHRRRRWLLGGAGLVGVGAVTAAAFGAYWYTSTGPQPAEALPAGVLGYAAIDLDPSGQQKLAALSVLKRVPAVSDELDLGGNPAGVDVTHGVLDAVLRSEDCDLSADDVTDWLGDRGAIAAVPDGDQPAVVVVAQVSDADAAREGLAALASCGGAGDEIGFDVDGEWAVVAQDQDTVDRVVAARTKGSLADDDDFRTWTEAAGDPGVVHLYAGPAAGAWYADAVVGELASLDLDWEAVEKQCPYPEYEVEDAAAAGEDFDAIFAEWEKCTERVEEELAATTEPSPQLQQLQDRLRDFAGAAITVRFEDDAVEVESAGDLRALGPQTLGGDGAGDALRDLPADTALAYTAGFGDGWFDELVTGALAPYAALGVGLDDAFDELERVSGLRLPEDASLLDGRTMAFALSSQADLQQLQGGGGLEDAGAGLSVSGDPATLEDLLNRVRPQVPADGRELLDTTAGDDVIAIGPDAGWRDQLVDGGGLGDVDGFDDVVEHADDASVAFYLDVDAVRSWIPEVFGGDQEVIDNLAAIDRVGGSTWESGGIEHSLLRVTTD